MILDNKFNLNEYVYHCTNESVHLVVIKGIHIKEDNKIFYEYSDLDSPIDIEEDLENTFFTDKVEADNNFLQKQKLRLDYLVNLANEKTIDYLSTAEVVELYRCARNLRVKIYLSYKDNNYDIK